MRGNIRRRMWHAAAPWPNRAVVAHWLHDCRRARTGVAAMAGEAGAKSTGDGSIVAAAAENARWRKGSRVRVPATPGLYTPDLHTQPSNLIGRP